MSQAVGIVVDGVADGGVAGAARGYMQTGTLGGAWAGFKTGALTSGLLSSAASLARLAKGGCFAAGTPLLTPEGWKPIEAFAAGDLVLSRDENNLAAPLETQPVEECFTRMARILRLTVQGIEIQTTGEHPFFVLGHAWLPANELQAGDFLATHTGGWARVDAVDATEVWGTVYNLRVHEDHTYFVGKEEWGFAVWAHNAACKLTSEDIDHFFGNTYRLRGAGALDKQFLQNNGFSKAQITTLRAEARSRGLLPATTRGRGGHPMDTRPTLDALDRKYGGPTVIIERDSVSFPLAEERFSKVRSHRVADRVYTDSATGEIVIVQSGRRESGIAHPREIDAIGDIITSPRFAEMKRQAPRVSVLLVEPGTNGQKHYFSNDDVIGRLDNAGYRIGSVWQQLHNEYQQWSNMLR